MRAGACDSTAVIMRKISLQGSFKQALRQQVHCKCRSLSPLTYKAIFNERRNLKKIHSGHVCLTSFALHFCSEPGKVFTGKKEPKVTLNDDAMDQGQMPCMAQARPVHF